MDCILLFDIDGTLVARPNTGASAGVLAMSKAAEIMTQTADLANHISFAGATDLDVARQLLEMGGVSKPTPLQKKTLLDHYVYYLNQFIHKDSYQSLGCPNEIVPLLKTEGAIIGLGTGNLKIGAAAKLKSAKIDHLFNIDLGGYGDDGEARADILRTAVSRCGKLTNTPVIVIGDTPKDIDAAHAIGARCIGIPFGQNTAQILKDSGADAISPSIDATLHQQIHHLLAL